MNAAVVAGLALAAWALGLRGATWPERALRAVAAAALAALALAPSRTSPVTRNVTTAAPWVLDGSASMAVGDRAREAAALVRDAPDDAALWVTTDDGARATQRAEVARAWPAAARSSRVVPAVARALEGAAGRGVVVVTDGEVEDRPEDVRALPAGCGPVRVVRVGRAPDDDVALGAARADALVFRDLPARVEARLRTRGAARTVQVTATDERGRALGSRRVSVPAGDHETPVALEVDWDEPGPHRVRLAASEPPGDDAPGDATADVAVTVLRDRLRVLLLAGRPSFDLRALRVSLRAHQNLDLVSFFILRTDGDVTMASQDELALIPFPTDELFREHLLSFDVVVMHDLDPEPYGLGVHLEALARYVRQGGGLLVVGATSLGVPAYRGGPLADVLPGRPAGHAADPGPFAPAPATAAATHPITRDLAVERWALAGAARVEAVARDATTLWAHPRLRTDDGDASPVIAARRAGAGRVLLVATDSLWRGGFPALARGGDPGELDRLWDRALAWLMGEASAGLRVEVEADGRGSRVRVAGGRAGEAVVLTLAGRDRGHEVRRVALDADGAGELATPLDVAGVRARDLRGDEVVAYAPGPAAGDERAAVGRSDAALRALVARCGGEVTDGVAPRDLRRGARGAARDGDRGEARAGALAALAAAALGAEWWSRRRRGLA